MPTVINSIVKSIFTLKKEKQEQYIKYLTQTLNEETNDLLNEYIDQAIIYPLGFTKSYHEQFKQLFNLESMKSKSDFNIQNASYNLTTVKSDST